MCRRCTYIHVCTNTYVCIYTFNMYKEYVYCPVVYRGYTVKHLRTCMYSYGGHFVSRFLIITGTYRGDFISVFVKQLQAASITVLMTCRQPL